MKQFIYHSFFLNSSMHLICKTVVLSIIVCFFLKPFTCFSQSLSEIVPVSPNVSSLETFGNIPVGAYTGVPDIQIPIYDIVVDNVTIPIKLQYHPGNVKKESVASWVGLGWSLSAGGLIGHAINGLDDFYSYQSNRQLSGQAINYIPKESETSQVIGLFKNYPFVDTEPDIYSFHIGDHSGTMFFMNKVIEKAQEKSVSPIIQSKGDPLKVSYNFIQGTWTIIDGNGNTYYFGTAEYTCSYSENEYCNNNIGVCNYNFVQKSYNPRAMYNDDKQKTAWVLDSIKTHLDHKIRFKYKDDYVTYYPSYSERKAYVLEHEGTLWNGTVPFFNFFSITYSSSMCQQKILSEIEFPHGKIEFETKDRQDVHGVFINNGSKVTIPQSLSSIKIYSMDQSLQREFTFRMEQRQTSSGFDKIFLTEVVQPDLSKYIFGYKSGSRGGYSVDYWGYENGKSRGYTKPSDVGYIAPDGWGTFIPSMFIKKSDSYQLLFGANRTSDVNYATNDLLTKIVYPTKGETQFSYELNDFSNTSYLDVSRAGLASYSLLVNTGYIVGDDNAFEIASEQSLVYITGNIQYSSSGNLSEKHLCPYLELRENTASGSLVRSFEINGNRTHIPFPLKKGKYVIIMKDNNNNTIDDVYMKRLKEECGVSYITSEILKITSSECNKGGGLRIKKIEDYDSNKSLIQKREFIYKKDGKSTGRLMTNLDFFKILSFRYGFVPVESKPEWDGLVRYYVTTYDFTANASIAFVSSASYAPSMPSASGSYVGYDYVEEHLYSPTKYEGMNRYYYYNKEDSVLYNEYYMEQYPILSDPMNGSLLEQQVYDSNSRLLRSTKYEYEANCLQEQTRGLSMFIFYGQESNPYRSGFCKEYPVYSQWNRMSKMTEQSYTNDSFLTPTTETYSYNDDNYQKKQIDVLLNSKEKKTTYEYPTSAIKGSILEQMKQKNIVLPVVEAKKYIGGKLVEYIQKEYKEEYGHFVPKAVNTSYRSSISLKEDLSYPYYNKGGYPCQINADEIPTVILWSYGDSRPIATIQGITYPEVKNILGDTFINNLSQKKTPLDSDYNSIREKLKDYGLVTTYIYDSWGNTCSVIDPRGIAESYEYDAVGRLINRKDYLKQILEKFEYHYKP